jgi:hypothetical protein
MRGSKSMFAEYNNNPQNKRVGDCVFRALSKALGKTWGEVYIDLSAEGFYQADSPQSISVWGKYLKDNGFKQQLLPDTCPACYTINQFCKDNPEGIFVVVTATHVVCVYDGIFFDTWNSGDETAVYFFEKRKEEK